MALHAIVLCPFLFLDWFKAVQALYAIAIVMILLAVITLMFLSCCRDKQGGGGIVAAGVFLIIACKFAKA